MGGAISEATSWKRNKLSSISRLLPPASYRPRAYIHHRTSDNNYSHQGLSSTTVIDNPLQQNSVRFESGRYNILRMNLLHNSTEKNVNQNRLRYSYDSQAKWTHMHFCVHIKVVARFAQRSAYGM